MGSLARFCLLLVLIGCRDPLGRPCAQDEECGPGFDCYRQTCVRVCTSDDECATGKTCYRYHCLEPGRPETGPTAKASQPPATSAPRAVTPPPTPDVIGAELRAIRRELELLRREQARLAEALEKVPAGVTKSE